MKAEQYKKVEQEALMYIEQGKPLTAANVMSFHEANLNMKQYYKLAHIIAEAVRKEYEEK